MAKRTDSLFRFFFIYLTIVIAIFVTYSKVSAYWVAIGGINTNPFDYQVLIFELPLIIIISSVFFCKKIQGNIFKYLLSALPILIFYIFFDIFYNFLRRSPHPSDLFNIHTVMDFFPSAGYIFLSVYLFLFVILFFILIRKSLKVYSDKSFFTSIIFRILIISSVLVVFSTKKFENYFFSKFNYIDWSQERTIKSNGRISSFIYYGMQERRNRKILNNFSKDYMSKNINIHNLLYPASGDINILRNIHLVVLESFIDPRLLKSVKFNISPLAPELSPFLLENEKFSLVKSPIYGGRTAQAEFELLTGIPALSKVDSVEFNVMMGNSANSFVKRLETIGYKSLATIASSSCYFNAKQAYRSIGFNKVTFLKELDKFAAEKDYLPIFDGDVFQYNINEVKIFKEKNKEKLFNYVIGMYGHFPYETVSEHHPDVVKTEHEDDRVSKIANQFFYRTKALAEYIKQLQSIDPDSIICIVSDHLPPILWEGTQYQLDQYINVAIFLNQGHPTDISGNEYYKIPWIIWESLLGKQKDKQISEEMMNNIYFKFLSESMF